MKKVFLIFVINFFIINCNAQITTITSGFSENLTKSDLNFSGDRKLYATNIIDRRSENYFVVSKNRSGAASDELYLEKFTKSGDNFKRTFSYKIMHPVNSSLAFINNRGSYSDVDKDGYYESISIVDAYENGPESKLEKIFGIIQFKNDAYVVSVSSKDGFVKNEFSSNFSTLPKVIADHYLQFWNGLKKD